MDNYKFGGCVVLYNPDDTVLSNIQTYLPFLDCLVAVDNCTKENQYVEQIKKFDKVKYISMNGNKGIASALNAGCGYLYENGFDFCLTMDQDSEFPIDDQEIILSLVKKYSKEYSLIGLNINNFVKNKTDKIESVPHWITSGNFINLKDYNEVGGFNSDLFIDYVDFDFNNKLLKHNKKIGYLTDYSLKHTIGNPIEIKLFGKKYYAMNHSPIRYYYRYRNGYFLYKQDKKFYKTLFKKEIFVNIPKMVIYESKKKEKFKMIFKGIKDAKRKNLGEFNL